MSHLFLIYAILCATLFCVSLAGVPLDNFHRFGKDHGDKETVGDDQPTRIDLEPPFRIFRKLRDYVYVRRYGRIDFAGGSIAPFYFYPVWYENRIGPAFYRQSTEEVDLDKARREIGSAFPAFQDIELKWVVIGTWKQIGNTQHPNALNTFQAILTTDGVRSFVLYNYNETKSWINSETWAGFKIPPTTTLTNEDEYSYKIEGSNTIDMLTINNRSNVNNPGKWIFRIDLPKIYEPSSMCPKPPQPVNGFCKAKEYTLESEAQCGCNIGYNASSLEILPLKCWRPAPNKTINWVGNTPVCRLSSQVGIENTVTVQEHLNSSESVIKNQPCPPPPVPQNALCVEKEYLPGSTANCTCLPNHHFKNPDSGIHCIFDKGNSLFWHGEVPVCALNFDA